MSHCALTLDSTAEPTQGLTGSVAELADLGADNVSAEAEDFTGDTRYAKATYTGAATKRFLVSACGRLGWGLTGDEPFLSIRVNGAEVEDRATMYESNPADTPIGVNAVLELEQNDYVEAWICERSGASSDITWYTFSLLLAELVA